MGPVGAKGQEREIAGGKVVPGRARNTPRSSGERRSKLLASQAGRVPGSVCASRRAGTPLEPWVPAYCRLFLLGTETLTFLAEPRGGRVGRERDGRQQTVESLPWGRRANPAGKWQRADRGSHLK